MNLKRAGRLDRLVSFWSAWSVFGRTDELVESFQIVGHTDQIPFQGDLHTPTAFALGYPRNPP